VKFRQITRREGLERVIAGIQAAKKAGSTGEVSTAVSIRGFTESESVPLARFARGMAARCASSSNMPIAPISGAQQGLLRPRDSRADRREVAPLVAGGGLRSAGPAMEFRYTDGGGRVGIIASVSRPFCLRCNRLRLTAEGKLRNCLFALDEVDVKSLLRTSAAGGDCRVIRKNVWAKWEGHEINTARFIKPLRTMHAIGG